MRDVCSRCACWVEKSWAFCKDCGAPRPAKRSPPTLSTSSLYSSSRCGSLRNTAALRSCHHGRRQRRQSSKDVDIHLRQWCLKSKTQEDLLQQLEHWNAATRQTVVSNAESDLRQVVRDGRELVRTWPKGSETTRTSTLTLPGTGKNRCHRKVQRNPVSATATGATLSPIGCSSNGNTQALREVEGRNGCPPKTPAVNGAETDDNDEPCNLPCPSASRSHFPVVSTSTAYGTPVSSKSGVSPQVGNYVQRPVECAQDNSTITSRRSAGAVTAAGQPSGWFWGEGGCSSGHVNVGRNDSGEDARKDIAAPGEGNMGAFWRHTTPRGGDALKAGGTFESRDPSASASGGADHYISSSVRASPADGSTATGRHPDGDDFAPKGNSDVSSTVSSKGMVNVASTKAAVRSASNRLAELSHLLGEGNNPPRDECLAKAEAAVRAAQDAVSCANERLFQLELIAAPSAILTRSIERSEHTTDFGSTPDGRVNAINVDGTVGVPPDPRNGHLKPDTFGKASTPCCSSSLLHIEQLSMQLRIAQSLQAASLTARARLSRRFVLEDAAAVRLQALARGTDVRRRERCEEESRRVKIPDTDDARTPLSGSAESIVGEKESAGAANSSSYSHSRSTGPQDNALCSKGEEGRQGGGGRSAMAPLPRREDYWWTLAEAEGAEEIEQSEYVLLKAVVNLQALVRSRLARSKTFAAVNARFVKHFDEEHQHPFFVCRETNSSQWKRPFGFDWTRKGRGDNAPPFSIGGDDRNHDRVALERSWSNNGLPDGRVNPTTVPVYSTPRAFPVEGRVSEQIASMVDELLGDGIGEPGRVVLDAIVKLQAVVRSRLSRSKTITAVNSRYTEHFDEEHQCAFYVCSETNVSQWNRPFGFGYDRGGNNDLRPFPLRSNSVDIPNPDAIVDGEARVFEEDAHATSAASNREEETDRKPRATPRREEEAAVVIQCAARAARARGQLAEKIMLASL